MYAVIRTGGKQYRVSEGDTIDVELLPVEKDMDVEFTDVLLVGDENVTRIGNPVVAGAKVTGKVVENGKAPKIVVFKIKRRKKERTKKGHRQLYTRLLISGINVE